MAKYIKQQVSDCIGGKATQHYFRLEHTGTMTRDDLAHFIGRPGSGLTETSVVHVLSSLPNAIAELMARGHSVKLDGVGTFRAKLGLKTDKELDEFEAQSEKSHRNARSLMVTGVNFRADKMLVNKTHSYCHLTKGGESPILKSTLSREERIAKALEYLDSHGIMRVADYQELTGLSRADAAKELRELRQDAQSGITSSGQRSALVYFRTPS